MAGDAREQYQQSLKTGDVRARVAALCRLAEEAIDRGEPLAVPHLAEEAIRLVLGRGGPFGHLERVRLFGRILRLWSRAVRDLSESY